MLVLVLLLVLVLVTMLVFQASTLVNPICKANTVVFRALGSTTVELKAPIKSWDLEPKA